MRHIFHAEQWLAYPVEAVFAFFANPENLPRLMPAWQKARIEEASFIPPPPRPDSAAGRTIAAGAGTRMILSFRPFPYAPIRIPWDAEISEFAWNDHFCDIQHRGPFAYWRHCHRLEPQARDGNPGTLLLDRIEYELSLGALGDLVNSLFIRHQMASTFRYRQQRLIELLPFTLNR